MYILKITCIELLLSDVRFKFSTFYPNQMRQTLAKVFLSSRFEEAK